jgi:hypothetical protein
MIPLKTPVSFRWTVPKVQITILISGCEGMGTSGGFFVARDKQNKITYTLYKHHTSNFSEIYSGSTVNPLAFYSDLRLRLGWLLVGKKIKNARLPQKVHYKKVKTGSYFFLHYFLEL